MNIIAFILVADAKQNEHIVNIVCFERYNEIQSSFAKRLFLFSSLILLSA